MKQKAVTYIYIGIIDIDIFVVNGNPPTNDYFYMLHLTDKTDITLNPLFTLKLY